MSKVQQQNPQTMNSTPLNLVSTEQIQKYLDENKNLIMAILECQNMGKVAECAQYQAILQKNLMYLAAVADAQPQPQGSTMPSQLPTSSIAAQGDPHTPQNQASAVHQQQSSGPVGKLPFQLNALRPTQEQQNQLLHFQQQQQQQQQLPHGQFNLGVGANDGGMHLLMQHGMGRSGGFMDASAGDGQRNSALGQHMEGRD